MRMKRQESKQAKALLESSGLIDQLPDRELTKMFGVHTTQLWELRRESGMMKLPKPIGCEECPENPYAKGLCRNCYERNRRRNRTNG